MSRRRKNDSVGNLDSLLDTMFNVVGFLVLVMIFTQLSVQTAVQNLTKEAMDLPDISMEELELTEEQAIELQAIVDKYKRKAAMRMLQRQRDKLTKKQVEAEIKKLKELVKLNPIIEAQTKKIEALIRQRKAELKKQMETLAKAMRQLELARAKLSDTPQREVLAASMVTLPDPRTAPKGFTQKKIIIREGKVWPLREQDLLAAAKRLAGQVRKIPADEENTGGLDPEILMKVFDSRGPKTPDIKITPLIAGTGKNLVYIDYKRREDGGVDIDSLNKPGSRFRRELVDAKRNNKYVRFMVYNDKGSFATYLAAREVADKYNVPAGWQLMHHGWGEYRLYLGAEYKVNRKKQEMAAEKEVRDKAAAERAKKPKPKPKPSTAPKVPPPKQIDKVPTTVID